MFSAVVLGILVAASIISPVHAASSSQANGFIISPVRTEITVKKGNSQAVQLSVQNPTDAQVTVKAVINDFVASNNESGDPRLILNSNSPLPANNFKSLVGAIPNITLGPHQKQYINIPINVPASANSGGYYGAIRFLPASTDQTKNVGLTASVGSIFLITVPGNLTEKLNLVQLSAAQGDSAKSFITSGRVSVLNRLENVGNIHVQPFGRVNVKNMFGKVVDSYEFNPAQGNILPNSTRKFVDLLKHKSWFGHYTIEESLAYQQGSGNLIVAKTTFWYFPVWFLVTVLAVIVLIIISILFWRQRRHKH